MATTDELFLEAVKARWGSLENVPTPRERVAGTAQAAEEFAAPPELEAPPLAAIPQGPGDPRNRDQFGFLTDRGFIYEYRRKDERGQPIPLDIDTGAPLGARLKLGLTSNTEAQQNILLDTFPGATVEQVEGGVIVRGIRDPETGAVKDLLVDERSPNFVKDMADLSGIALETAGAAALSLVTGGGAAGGAILRTGIKQALAGTAGATAAGVAGEAAVGGAPIERIKEAPGELLFDAGLQALPYGVGRLVDKFALGSRGPLQKALIESYGRIREQTGIDIVLSPSQTTGMKALAQREALAMQTPTGNPVIRKMMESQRDSMKQVQEWALGAGPLPDRLATNTRAIRALSNEVDLQDALIFEKRINDIKDASDKIRDMIEKATPAGKSAYNSESGLVARSAFKSVKERFDTVAAGLYEDVISSGDPKFNIKGVRKQIRESKKDLARAKTEEKVVESSLLDEFGRPFTSTVEEGGKIIPGQPEAAYSKFINEIRQLPDDVPLSQLRRLRTRINTAIKDNKILLQRDDVDLIRLSRSIHDAIERGTEELGGSLKQKLDRANKFYRTNIPLFQDKELIKLLADPNQAILRDEDIVSEALKPTYYKKLKAALTSDLAGDRSEELVKAGEAAFDTLKRAILNKQIGPSLEGHTYIHPRVFANNVMTLDQEIIDDLLSPSAQKALARVSNSLTPADTMDAVEMLELIKNPDVSSTMIAQAVRQTKKENQLYKNKIIKSLVKDKVDPDDVVRADEFVDKFLQTGSTQEVAEVWDIIRRDPELEEDVQRLTLQSLFRRMDTVTSGADTLDTLESAKSRLFNAEQMSKYLGDETEARKLKLIVGPAVFQTIKDLTVFQIARKEIDTAGKAAGSFAGMSMVQKLASVDAWPQHVKHLMSAVVLSNPVLRKLAMRKDPIDTIDAARVLAISGPFIQALFSDEAGEIAEFLQAGAITALPLTTQPQNPTQAELIEGISAAAQASSQGAE